MSTQTVSQSKAKPKSSFQFQRLRDTKRVTAFCIHPYRKGLHISLEGHVTIKPRRGLPEYIRGTIEHKYQSIPVIDPKARETECCSPITDKACIVLTRNGMLPNVYNTATLYHDVMDVVNLVTSRNQWDGGTGHIQTEKT